MGSKPKVGQFPLVVQIAILASIFSVFCLTLVYAGIDANFRDMPDEHYTRWEQFCANDPEYCTGQNLDKSVYGMLMSDPVLIHSGNMVHIPLVEGTSERENLFLQSFHLKYLDWIVYGEVTEVDCTKLEKVDGGGPLILELRLHNRAKGSVTAPVTIDSFERKVSSDGTYAAKAILGETSVEFQVTLNEAECSILEMQALARFTSYDGNDPREYRVQKYSEFSDPQSVEEAVALIASVEGNLNEWVSYPSVVDTREQAIYGQGWYLVVRQSGCRNDTDQELTISLFQKGTEPADQIKIQRFTKYPATEKDNRTIFLKTYEMKLVGVAIQIFFDEFRSDCAPYVDIQAVVR